MVSLTETTAVKARVLDGATMEWSALKSAEYFIPTGQENLLINEIMYNPPVNGDHEFIEIKNNGTTTADLSGIQFNDGIDYTFPVGSVIAPGGIVVIATSPVDFEAHYGFAPTNAIGFEGKLSNGGESLALANPDGTPFLTMEYDDADPWPEEADGDGYSIVPVDPNANPDPSDPANWRRSTNIDGSPGLQDPTPPVR